uniref:Integrase catalytic domain-containing protein n=1 Tax=Caenorhabditis tropicalis TaxID=1561998 RepID=A0A1I7UZK3_9PELO
MFSEFEQFRSSRGIRHLRSPLFHPQSNGKDERFFDTFKRGLIKLRREATTREILQTLPMSIPKNTTKSVLYPQTESIENP